MNNILKPQQRFKFLPGSNYETEAQKKGFRFIFGIDEAGRGPLAGPVVAAAVHLKTFDFTCSINDSKKMTPASRQRAFLEIFEKADVGIGIISEKVIDIVNILNASHMAMDAAVLDLISRVPEGSIEKSFGQQVMLLVDGNLFRTRLPYKYQTIVAGDSISLSIAAASVIAKVTRDRILNTYDRVYPQYGFSQHKGYPTASHRQAIRQYGLSSIHRKSFNME